MFKENRIIFSRLGSVGSGRTGSGSSGGGVNRAGQRTGSYDSSGGALAGQDPRMLSAVAMGFTTKEARDAAKKELQDKGLWVEPTAKEIKDAKKEADNAPANMVTDETGMRFNFGIPEIDDFMNNVYLPIWEAEFSADPNALLNSDAFDMIKERVEATYGPIFKRELAAVNDAYNLKRAGTSATDERTQRELADKLSRSLEDIQTGTSRIESDLETGKGRISRNYGEALEDSRAAMANRGLSFGGTRQKGEDKLTTQRDEGITDLQNAANRKMQDLATEKLRMQGDIPYEQGYQTGVTNRQQQSDRDEVERRRREIEGERTIQESMEKERLRTLGATVIGNEEFAVGNFNAPTNTNTSGGNSAADGGNSGVSWLGGTNDRREDGDTTADARRRRLTPNPLQSSETDPEQKKRTLSSGSVSWLN